MAARGTTRTLAPLRPGPAGPDRPAEMRDRILDAAAGCLLEAGLTARVHALIAERAGVSRPTVYKYVGDQHAIAQALMDREFDRFFDAVLPRLRVRPGVVEDLLDGVALVVDYGRRHQLLQAMLREHPEIVLPALTTESGPVLERALRLFEEPMAVVLEGRTSVSARVATEWFFRIIVSLLTTPGSVGASQAEIRAYAAALPGLFGPGATDEVTASSRA